MTKITSIHPILKAIESKEEFIVIDKGDYKVVDYVFQQPTTFDDPLVMECRGIKFCKDDMILARPFRKFFNYGENGSDLPIWRPHYVTEKLDGSMIHPVVINGRLYLHTRKGHTDVAKQAERFMISTDRDYAGLCRVAFASGWTPIFEYIGPNNRIVLRYDEENLVLLAMRRLVDGAIMEWTQLNAWCRHYKVPVVGRFGSIKDKDVFVETARKLEGAEGYVVYFDDGYMVKIKAEDYVLQHRALDDMSSKKKVVALCAQGFADDVLPMLSDADKKELIDFGFALNLEIQEYVNEASHLYDEWELCRKDFALKVAPHMQPKWMAGVVFGLMDGKEPRKMVIDLVVRHWKDVQVKWRGQ